MPTSTPDSPQNSVPSVPDDGHGYGSFVVRWRRAARERDDRIELEHIQSGDRTRVSSATGAVAWMRHRVGDARPADLSGPADTVHVARVADPASSAPAEPAAEGQLT